MKKFFVAGLTLFLSFTAIAQKQNYKVAIVAFYNLENFFDTIQNHAINDNEFIPTGNKKYNSAIYWDKVNRLSTVISQIGTEMNPDGPAILGVAEIENDTVLADLVKHDLIKNRNYQFVHYDSRDFRGIDVGLLYNPKYFTVEKSANLLVKLPSGSKNARYTRDILWVQGKLDGETVHVYVNHWPSRSGGEERSQPARIAAAQVLKDHLDSLLALTPNVKTIIMGDLNDDPVSHSVAGILKAKGKIKDVKPNGLFNPWMDMYKKGIGTLAYRDAWGLFDQIIISHAFLDKNQDGFFYYLPKVFNREYMVENMGRYKGYPMRTWDGDTYRAGYSDHFPTYLIMLKKVP